MGELEERLDDFITEFQKMDIEISKQEKVKSDPHNLWDLFKGDPRDQERKTNCWGVIRRNPKVIAALKLVARHNTSELLDHYATLLDRPNWKDMEDCVSMVFNHGQGALYKAANILHKHDVVMPIRSLAAKFKKTGLNSALEFLNSDKVGIPEYAEFLAKFPINKSKDLDFFVKAFSKYDILAQYEDKKAVLKSIKEMGRRIDEDVRIKACGLFEKKEIAELFKKEQNAAVKVIDTYLDKPIQGLALSMARVCLKYDDSMHAARLVYSNRQSNHVQNLVNLLDKYSNVNVISEIKDVDKIDYTEILSDKAYRAISKNPKLIKEILYGNYSSYTMHIRLNCGYKELKLVKKTHNLVLDIHEGRTYPDRQKIEENFFDELNRALSQADDYKGKVRNLRRYCHEVRQLMKDNADELMVITNG